MNQGRKPEYPEKTPDDRFQKRGLHLVFNRNTRVKGQAHNYNAKFFVTDMIRSVTVYNLAVKDSD